MATLNASTKGRMRTTNKSGYAAYRLDDKTRLVAMSLTTMLGEPKFYGDNTNELIKLAEKLCDGGEVEFVCKLAVWARTKGNLRSVSHALMAVAARHKNNANGPSPVRKAARMIASQRGDDGTEMLATYLALYGKEDKAHNPNALRRGICDALQVAKPYSIAKYQSSGKAVKLRDTLRITHPNAARSDTEDAMGKAVDGTLAVPKSWETELSARGNTKEVWEELLSEGRVGIMAALRNMRNIIKSSADIQPVLDMLENPDVIARSRQLPFRFFSAYRELANAGLATTSVARALDGAMMLACGNVDRLDGRTAVLIDTSGSMGSPVSRRSTVSCAKIAAVLGAMATHISDDAWVAHFDTSASVVPMTGTSIIGDIKAVPRWGGGTDMATGFDCLIQSGYDADRVIVLSDNEVNGGGFWHGDNKKVIQGKLDEYRRHVGHDVWCHAIDLQGYGTSQFIGPKLNIMAGWSEQVLRFISMAENGFGTLADEITSLDLG